MPTSTISVRFDPNVKKEFEVFCDNVGLNPSTAITLFVKTVLRERRIPFDIVEHNDSDDFRKLFSEMRTEAEARGFLTDGEIEAEIKAARAEMKAGKKI
jgi:addiction module RelB/DinJ family antitoxin